MSFAVISASILIVGIYSFTSFVFAYSSKAFLNFSKFSCLILRPIARACPPYCSRYLLVLFKASCKSKHGILLPEPLPIPSSQAINIVGFENFSVILYATILITP